MMDIRVEQERLRLRGNLVVHNLIPLPPRLILCGVGQLSIRPTALINPTTLTIHSKRYSLTTPLDPFIQIEQ